MLVMRFLVSFACLKCIWHENFFPGFWQFNMYDKLWDSYKMIIFFSLTAFLHAKLARFLNKNCLRRLGTRNKVMTSRCLIAWSVNAMSVSTTSSDSEVSYESCDSSKGLDWEQSDSSDSETRVIDGVIIPYEDEPLADCGEEARTQMKKKQILMDLPRRLRSLDLKEMWVWIQGKLKDLPWFLLNISRADMRSCVAKFVR